jgi:hypothetical protein
MTRSFLVTILVLTAVCATAQKPAAQPDPQRPTPAAAPWWHYTRDLANDRMEGRDTGSDAYLRAAEYVASQFRASGLQPAGDASTFFQRVDMHQVDLDDSRSTITFLHPRGEDIDLKFSLHASTVPRSSFSLDHAKAVFVGYGLPLPSTDLKGKVAIFFAGTPASLSQQERENFAARRARALADSGAAVILSIDNPFGTEPFHWPAAYSRSVTLKPSLTPPPSGPPVIRLNPTLNVLASFMDETAAQQLLDAARTSAPLPSFEVKAEVRIRLAVTEKDISSPNIIGILPGSDPKLAPEFVAVSAHLDGYGYGTPVAGDTLYNGALDDAAYVATLLDLADQLHKHPPARSLLFCIFTGEEKGLLGSVFYTQHPTVPVAQIVADLNLDQLRPIFPLTILTMEGIADSTLGETARSIAQQFKIELRPDRETERNLFRRADNYSFVRIGVPIAGFIFGYNPGTPEERIYRDWYARRYHKPQDDLMTPIDWAAAVKFNDFYKALVLNVANTPARPQWLPASPYGPKPAAKSE